MGRSLAAYWSRSWLGEDMVKKHFTRARFWAILSHLHFCDPAERPEPMEEGSERLHPSDRNWKMAPVEKLFVRAWQDATHYCQILAVDESMIKYKGSKDIRKQRLVTKPIPNGLKAFVLAGARRCPHRRLPRHLPCRSPAS